MFVGSMLHLGNMCTCTQVCEAFPIRRMSFSMVLIDKSVYTCVCLCMRGCSSTRVSAVRLKDVLA